jgi:serine/threonine-protein kinase HipA
MTDTIVDVVVQIAGEDLPAGRFWAHPHGRSGSGTFAYLPEYLARHDSYELDPRLGKHTGQQQTAEGQALFGAFSDAAPDGWGRRLIRRNEIHHAEKHGGPERDIPEIDYLLGVRDPLRQGALRFRTPAEGTCLADDHRGVPHLVDLPRLLTAAEQLERDQETDEDLQLLLAGGSSLGGARPKAHVLDTQGQLNIAKFPAPENDKWDVIRWEATALTLACAAGLRVPQFRLHELAGRPVLIVRRFDRDTRGRVGYVSAMTMLEANDGAEGSYVEMAEVIEQHSPATSADLRELWRRIVFSRLISNTDDHLRNHGFLRTSTAGWSLSPAFDLNPNPQAPGRGFSTVIEERRDRSDIEAAVELAGLFRLTPQQALATLEEVARATSSWRDVAKGVGLKPGALERMTTAFENSETRIAGELLNSTTSH